MGTMTTIKSYTDINQSCKLAEVFPPESADMWYQHTGFSFKNGTEKTIYFPMVIRDCESGKDIPCWSLAALLSIIPQELFGGEYIINITEGLDNKWIISYEAYYGTSSYLSASNDNLIDCCVDIIEKLNKRKML